MKSTFDIHHFNQLFNEYYAQFVRFANGYVRDEALAEDFVSEAFTVFWEKREELLSNSNSPAYILTIIKNKCLNHLHHIQIRQRIETELNEHNKWALSTSISTLEACNPDFLFSDEVQQIINKTLEKLPSKTRRIFVLSRYQGFTYKEIAEKMNLSNKSIEFHISKALAKFRLTLKDFIVCCTAFFFFS